MSDLIKRLESLRGDFLGDGINAAISRVEIIHELTSAHEAIKVLREALEKIASFCPPDLTVDQLDTKEK